ncbi:phosphatase PAP2 family protein [Nocardioides sp. T2.26MG-1]|uniref:phosphatase PAP2 family protein n=1 Tax=Nocardioides sp. T2.26MG-1 TaxID=3041166 RepID=UPI00253F9073|nr:phosphatase PAP2 family protein [Nocardioides sp. T2.26MG-1]
MDQTATRAVTTPRPRPRPSAPWPTAPGPGVVIVDAADDSTPVRPRRVTWAAVRAAAAELGLIAAVYLAYRAGRMLTAGSVAVAHQHSLLVRQVERAMHLPSEAAIQHAVGGARLFEAANVYYVSVHFPLTIAFLVWGFVARPRAEYRWARNLLVVQTLTAVAVHIAFPLAPPRMFPQWGFLDTMSRYGPSAYDGASATVANQYAAMPSLHVGWAVLIAFVVIRTGPRWLGWLTAAHALATFTVVTVTANHWFLDTVVAVGFLGLALVVFPEPGRTRLPRPWRRRSAASAA